MLFGTFLIRFQCRSKIFILFSRFLSNRDLALQIAWLMWFYPSSWVVLAYRYVVTSWVVLARQYALPCGPFLGCDYDLSDGAVSIIGISLFAILFHNNATILNLVPVRMEFRCVRLGVWRLGVRCGRLDVWLCQLGSFLCHSILWHSLILTSQECYNLCARVADLLQWELPLKRYRFPWMNTCFMGILVSFCGHCLSV